MATDTTGARQVVVTRRRMSTAFVCAVLCATMAACGSSASSPKEEDSQTSTATPTVAPMLPSRPPAVISTPAPPPPPVKPVQTTDASKLVQGFKKLPGRDQQLTIAWAPVGHPEQVQQLGTTDTIDAWSTIKVPLALAAIQQRGGDLPKAVANDIEMSVRISDNDAARRLWEGLENFGMKAELVNEVLGDTGDKRTRAARNSAGVRVPFGLTAWRVNDAAKFAATLPCVPYGAQIMRDMRFIDHTQSWGIGAVARGTNKRGLNVDDVAFKGGWGPSTSGYLMRQVGVLILPGGGGVGVALLVQPHGGNHDAGAKILSQAASWLRDSLGATDAGKCA
ncbi:hypothetical protein [Dermatophilus congolensis]|uniref:Beta-lactamase n=1 Tax=Dermatophilus congolensis TaxID=1863 RepID=A0A239VIY6_9MICO|nr:hypothetical protein [Dermatophilus congolensis]MBO3140391.1 hypothetical protein [Dermatophilus congolensis]MBO3145570.1 hypothetical protein [Dermatophilus congolensis]MBO3147098.1 hypothetical protein [Dermatophilus congolensis]MBO3149377.1 hypothetical protein [Dermatophilus congolensis]MBO3154568.1 hypothetical protein [Dermatophilus congolensis]